MESSRHSDPARPSELVVHDAVEPCPYLPRRQARMPLRLPTKRLTAAQFDRRMREGDRRCGSFLYRTQCPDCRACEPIRIPVDEFTPSRRHGRILRRNDQLLSVHVGSPAVDDRRVALYNRHRRERGLSGCDSDLTHAGYRDFLVNTCCDTAEMSFIWRGRLVAAGIVDRGDEALSAVYTYFDPDQSRLSLGVYAILKQIELCRQWRVRYLYLGLYIAESSKMAYKAEYLPHQRLINGAWLRFEA